MHAAAPLSSELPERTSHLARIIAEIVAIAVESPDGSLATSECRVLRARGVHLCAGQDECFALTRARKSAPCTPSRYLWESAKRGVVPMSTGTCDRLLAYAPPLGLEADRSDQARYGVSGHRR